MFPLLCAGMSEKGLGIHYLHRLKYSNTNFYRQGAIKNFLNKVDRRDTSPRVAKIPHISVGP